MGPLRLPKRKSTTSTSAHSIALWCNRTTTDHSELKPSLEFHVNLWRLEKRSNGVTVNALDIGMRIKNAKSIESLHLYLPFSVTAADVSDLAHLLEKIQIAIAIFNEDLNVITSAPDTSQFAIESSLLKLACWKLNVKTDIIFYPELHDATSGTTMVFTNVIFSGCSSDSERYVRLRINLSSAGQAAFFTRYDPIDRGLLSGFDETEVVDFRFNERRNLSREVVAKMNDDLEVSKINYFVIRDMTEDLTLADKAPRKCRTLEPDVWSIYIANGSTQSIRIRHAIIFYWRMEYENSKFKDFNALSRFRKRRTNIRTIVKSVAWLILFGVFSGWIASCIPTMHFGAAATQLPVPSKSCLNQAAGKNAVACD